jgi:hypothetical protein
MAVDIFPAVSPTVADVPALPSAQQDTPPPLVYRELHPTFGAEVSGADFSNAIPALVDEIKHALAKVSCRSV